MEGQLLSAARWALAADPPHQPDLVVTEPLEDGSPESPTGPSVLASWYLQPLSLLPQWGGGGGKEAACVGGGYLLGDLGGPPAPVIP